jgi:hypothetical protein
LALLDHIVFRQLSEFIAYLSAHFRYKYLKHHDLESLNDIITIHESLLHCLEGIAIFFYEDIFIALIHLKLKANEASLLILKDVEEEIACHEGRGLGVVGRLVLGGLHDRLQVESADVLYAVARVEGVQHLLSLIGRGGEELAILIDVLFELAADEGLN